MIGYAVYYGSLLLPLGVIAITALVCRSEHAAGGWRQTDLLPASRSMAFLAKLGVVTALIGALQILAFAALLLDGLVFFHIGGAVPWGSLLLRQVLSWIAAVPLVAVQLWAGTAFESIGTQFAIGAMLALPSALEAHSVFGPYDFWAQPAVILSGRAETLGLLSVWIVGSAAVVLIGGAWTYFVRRDIA